jgi:hypothetical protein
VTQSGDIFSYEKWSDVAKLGSAYRSAQPFPHFVFDDFLPESAAQRLHQEFPGPSDLIWTQYKHVNSNKLGKSDMAQFPAVIRAAVEEFLSPAFTEWLSRLTGIPDLIADPGLEGGGLHQIERGGFLNIHADFDSHYRNSSWARRVNLLLYLNPNWDDKWEGSLELWDDQMKSCQKRISPLFNRAVILSTDADSFHGHPEKLQCPVGVTRKSIALYYYTLRKQSEAKGHSPTNYRPRPEDSYAHKLLIHADRGLIRVYSSLRLKLGFSDGWISKPIAAVSRLFKKWR